MNPTTRIVTLACCGFTLIWLSSCGAPATDSSAEKSAGGEMSMAEQIAQRNANAKAKKQSMAEQIAARNAAQAEKDVADAAASRAEEQARLAAEGPSPLTIDDMKKGKSLKGGGYMSTVARTRFTAEHKVILQSVDYAQKLYYASEGKYPESHEEFMKKIVEANEIALPELDGPYEYWYNAEVSELWKRPILDNRDEETSESESDSEE